MQNILIFILLYVIHCYSEKILIYDEEKGILFVNKDSLITEKQKIKNKKRLEKKQKGISNREESLIFKKNEHTIHLNREKDPPVLYFKSGLEYYKNEDFENALKNFEFAFKIDQKPEYGLWVGKTYRQLDKPKRMFAIMKSIIRKYPESDVADDALFEMAFSYQKENNYHDAILTYTRVAEQHPFGVSYSNGVKFIDVAQKQIRFMRGEIMSSLMVLGINKGNMQESFSAFQRMYDLPVTGIGDSVTISTIKKVYNKKIKEEGGNREALNRFYTDIRWMSVLFILHIITLLFNINTRFKIAHNREQLVMLKDFFSDLQ